MRFSNEGYAALCKPKSKETREKMSANWTAEKRLKQSKMFRLCNPMHDPEHRKKYDKATLGRIGLRRNDEAKQKMSEAWTNERREKLKKRMIAGGSLQAVMQKNGNERRRGKSNKAAKKWFSTLTLSQKAARSENLSRKISARFRGQWRRRGLQEFLQTRFGHIRADSSWEKGFLFRCDKLTYVTDVVRDFKVPYKWNNSWHIFLVDFRVEFKKRKPLLVEIKCPHFIDAKCRAKVRAARNYAKKNGMEFRLLTSLTQVEVFPCRTS